MTLGHSNWTILSIWSLFLEKKFSLYQQATCNLSLFLHAEKRAPPSKRQKWMTPKGAYWGHPNAISVKANLFCYIENLNMQTLSSEEISPSALSTLSPTIIQSQAKEEINLWRCERQWERQWQWQRKLFAPSFSFSPPLISSSLLLNLLLGALCCGNV